MTEIVVVPVLDDLVVELPADAPERVRRARHAARLVRCLAVEADVRGDVLAVDLVQSRDGRVRLLTACVPKPARRRPERPEWETDSEGWKHV